jgi:2-oxoisovalerate ferredoxin oxidoreductase beta subunit
MTARPTVAHQRPKAFFPQFDRKPDLKHQTHYCPGCGHGTVQKLLAWAIDRLGIQDQVVFVSPVGCAALAYCYLDVAHVLAAHGRAPAVATALTRSLPGSAVIAYQGDGDLAAIGTAEIVHAANRGENLAVIFVNNGVYGMTGGQMAPTTPLGMSTSTTPRGRHAAQDGYPLRICELLATLDAPVYLERVALGGSRQVMRARGAILRALKNQVQGLGFSLVEVLAPCPTIWNMMPIEAQRYAGQELTSVFPVDVFRDRVCANAPRPPMVSVSGVELDELLGIDRTPEQSQAQPRKCAHADWRIVVAGSGGQGVLLVGEVLAAAGLKAGMEVSWLPSYGPEMRSGTCSCQVRVCSAPVDSPLVGRPNILLAMNEPSLRKFLPLVEPGGWVLFDGTAPEQAGARDDISMLAAPFTGEAAKTGDPRAANMVMLGALLELTGAWTEQHVDAVLNKRVTSERWLEVDQNAILRGRALARETYRMAS